MSETISKALPKYQAPALNRANLLRSLTFIALFAVIGIFFVWSRTRATTLSYEINRLEDQLRDLQQVHRSLQVEEASLSSPMRIEQIATQRLGLRFPGQGQIRQVR